MIKFITQEIPFEKSLKQRLEFICQFCKTKPIFINGNIRKIDKTIAEYQNIQELSVTLKEVESELFNNRDRIRLLLKNNEELNSEVDSLKDKSKLKMKISMTYKKKTIY